MGKILTIRDLLEAIKSLSPDTEILICDEKEGWYYNPSIELDIDGDLILSFERDDEV